MPSRQRVPTPHQDAHLALLRDLSTDLPQEVKAEIAKKLARAITAQAYASAFRTAFTGGPLSRAVAAMLQLVLKYFGAG